MSVLRMLLLAVFHESLILAFWNFLGHRGTITSEVEILSFIFSACAQHMIGKTFMHLLMDRTLMHLLTCVNVEVHLTVPTVVQKMRYYMYTRVHFLKQVSLIPRL